jgi:hypothetical protein
MSEQPYTLYVGVDWADAEHRVLVLDAERQVVEDWVIAHTGEALTSFTARLSERAGGEPSRVAVALEIPRGPIVDALLDRGCHVYALNPKQLDRFRDRFTVAGAKDDRRDAQTLADALVTDRLRAFRRVAPEDPRVIQLRELSRVEAELQEEGRRLANRLRAQLHRYYVQPLRLCPGADELWLWALLTLAPTPAAAARLSEAKLGRLLREHRIRRLAAPALRVALQAPALPAGPGVVEAASAHVALLVPRLRLVHAQRQACARQLEALMDQLGQAVADGERGQHRDVTILRSLPGVGRLIAATMLAEASRPLTERDYHALRGQSGVAPITEQSGQRRVVGMRQACNHRLRQALYHWSRVSTQVDPLSQAHYAALRRRGHSHARALRGVSDRLLRVLIAMLRTGTLYDASKRHPRHAAA